MTIYDKYFTEIIKAAYTYIKALENKEEKIELSKDEFWLIECIDRTLLTDEESRDFIKEAYRYIKYSEEANND